MTLFEELAWRGFVNQTTYPDTAALDAEPITFYWGVDPSASSMTIGNLAAAMMVKCLIKHGHKPVLLVGGATGLIGDPDGKREERSLKSVEEIGRNKQAIVDQYHQIFDGIQLEVVDNHDWFKDMHYLEFLREIGKHVPMRQMLARDFVQTRLSEQGAGISYAEFSYVLVQAYDFLYLYQNKGVTLQVCGSDQWGNSIAGVDLIRRKTGGEAHVYSVPLIVNQATGQKFGKSEAGAVWLDSQQTSIYAFYQFWLNVDDAGVEGYLKVFTELDKAAVDQVMQQFSEQRGQRLAQKTLAFEVTKLVHGQDQAEKVRQASEVLFGDASFRELDEATVNLLRAELPVAKAQDSLITTVVTAGLATSNSEAMRLLASGGVAINGQKATEQSQQFQSGNNLLKVGKNNFAIIEVG